MFLISLVVFIVGIVLLVRGIRGEWVGEDPHCRACGFNLRGRDPASTRCSECGAELERGAITDGFRRRRAGLIWMGLVMAVVGGAMPALWSVYFVRNIDWATLKPASWLFADLDSSDVRARNIAWRELQRRIDVGSMSAGTANELLDKILARQADRTKKWDTIYGDLFEGMTRYKVDQARVERYLKQGVSATLEIKPKLRRGQSYGIDLNLKCDRYGSSPGLRGSWETSPLMIGETQMREENWASHPNEDDLAQQISYGSGGDSRMWKDFKGPDGKYEAKATITMTVSSQKYTGLKPVMIDLPVSAPVEVCPADAVVDEFKVDPELRDAMKAAVMMGRITRDDEGKIRVVVRVKDLPMAIAGVVTLVQGETSQRIGIIRMNPERKEKWFGIEHGKVPKLSGAWDIHIRPDPKAADGERKLGTYWGEEIVIPNVTVNAPYDPPFVRDESLRPKVEAALRARPPRIRRRDDKSMRDFALLISLDVQSSPVKVSFEVVLKRDGREVIATSPLAVGAKQNSGTQIYCRDVDPEGKASSCDLILRPNLNWETNAFDQTPPWFGEIVFHDVKIESAP